MNSTNYKTDIVITLDENQLVTLAAMVANNNRYMRGLNHRNDMVEVTKIVYDALKEIPKW
jgi:hypothetical protein